MVQADPQNDERSDLELIEAAKVGGYEAFEVLVNRYRDRVYRLAYSMTKNESEAEEVVQDAFLNMLRKLDQFRAEASPGSWIYRVAANSALMRMRAKRRKPLLSLEDQPPALARGAKESIWPGGLWSRTPAEAVLRDELRGKIEQAVERLPEKYRLVLLLRDVEGMSNAETADALGLTVPTVKSRLHRSRLFIRGELERYFDEK